MQESLKSPIGYSSCFNPLTVYWYTSVYRENMATAYPLVGSVLLSLGLVFLLKRNLPLKWWTFSIIVLISNFSSPQFC